MLWGHRHRPGQHGTHSPAEPISIHGAGGSASSEKGARHWGARRRRRGRRGATGTLTRPRGGVATASSQRARSESSRQEQPPSGGSTPLARGRRSVRRGEGSAVRNLRRPRPLTLGLPLHDCGAAADLPGGRPRKPAGVSSAAPARRTSKPRLSVPSRAGATSVRTRPARGTQGRCGERAASVGGAWGTRGGAGPPLRCAGRRRPGGAALLGPPWCGALPACDVAEGGVAYLGRSYLERGWSRCRGPVPSKSWAGPPSFPSLSLHAQLGRPYAPPPQLVVK